MSIRALLTLAVLAHGADAGTLVHWQAPETCPDDDVVDAHVASRLGSAAQTAAPIDVTVHRDAAGFVADIAGSRTLTSASCSELAEAVALVVARLVLEQPQRAPVAVAAAPRVEPHATVRIAAAPPVPEPSAHELALGARASATSGVGAQPGLSLGEELAVHVHTRAVFVELAGALWSDTSTNGAMGGVRASLREGLLRAGWIAPHHVRVWLASELGSLHGEGTMVVAARGGSAMWAGLGAGGAIAFPIERTIAIVAAGEIVAALLRPQFALGDGDLLYQPSTVAARLSLGLEIDWP